MGDVVQSVGNFLGVNQNQTNTSGYSPSGGENSFMSALQAQMNGSGPNPAALQMQQGLDQANANAAGAAAATRGISPGLAAQTAARAQSANAMQTNQQTGILNAQQQIAAENELGNMYNSERQSAGQANALTAQQNSNAANRADGLLSGMSGGMMQMSSGSSGAAASGAGESGPGAFEAGTAGGGGSLLGAGAMAFSHGGPVPLIHHLMNAHRMMQLKAGGPVPGQATVQGDSPQNDTVPAMLSPKEIVLPRSVTQAPNAPDKAAEFVASLKKQKDGEKESKGYAGIAEAKRKLQEALKHLERN